MISVCTTPGATGGSPASLAPAIPAHNYHPHNMSSDDRITPSPDDRLARANLVRRIGFLRRGEPFDTGDVDEIFFEKLCQLAQRPWQPWAYAGVHFCDLCRFVGNGAGTYFGRDQKSS